MRQSDKLSLTVKRPSADWLDRLSTLPGILNVFPTAQRDTCTIECQLGQDLRDELSRFVVSHGYGLLELKPLSLSLEDVFLHLTQREERSEGNPADPGPDAPATPGERAAT